MGAMNVRACLRLLATESDKDALGDLFPVARIRPRYRGEWGDVEVAYAWGKFSYRIGLDDVQETPAMLALMDKWALWEYSFRGDGGG